MYFYFFICSSHESNSLRQIFRSQYEISSYAFIFGAALILVQDAVLIYQRSYIVRNKKYIEQLKTKSQVAMIRKYFDAFQASDFEMGRAAQDDDLEQQTDCPICI